MENVDYVGDDSAFDEEDCIPEIVLVEAEAEVEEDV